MELAFFGPHFGNVDVEEADRVSFELLLRRLAPLDISSIESTCISVLSDRSADRPRNCVGATWLLSSD
jgi:hypothetical protein